LAASKLQDALGTSSAALSSGEQPAEQAPAAALLKAAQILGVLLLVAAVAWRARFGLSFFDDGYYASLPFRLSQGARPFADEMTAQGLGFLIPALFTKVWHAVFGLYGLVLALRLLYVAAAVGTGIVVYRALRPSYPAFASFIAVAAPLLALPYNIVGLSYNTTALLGFLLAWALAFRAARDGTRGHAFAAGVTAVAGAISHPPLVLGALALLITSLVVRQARRIVLPALTGAVTTFAAFVTWLLAVTSVAEVRAALAYSSGVLDATVGLGERTSMVATQLWGSVTTPWLIPMWVCAAVACLRWFGWPGSRVAALLIPVAAFVPSVVALRLPSPGDAPPFGALGGAYLIVLTAGLFVPILLWTVREGGDDMRLALSLATPLSIVNTLAAAYFTSSGWEWAVPVVGLAPLVTASLAGWFRICVDARGAGTPASQEATGGAEAARRTGLVFGLPAAVSVIGVLALGALLGLLYATAFKDAPPHTLTRRLTAPAVVGIITQDVMAQRVSELAAAGQRWVQPDEGVLFVHGPLGYVLVEGRMVTNAVWLATGPSDARTLAYFERTAGWPDVAFVSSSLLESLEGDPGKLAEDPLLTHLDTEYERVDEAGGFVIYRRP
jgi:hypothetical protein